MRKNFSANVGLSIKVELQASAADTVSSTIMPANAGCPAKYAVRFRGSVSRRGAAAAAAMEDANGDLTGRKVLYFDSTTTAGFVGIDEPSGSACYKRSTSWRCNPVIVSAQLAGRRCAIVRQRLRDASTGTVRSFSPSHDEADHNLASLRHIASLRGRKARLEKCREDRIRVPTDDCRKIPT